MRMSYLLLLLVTISLAVSPHRRIRKGRGGRGKTKGGFGGGFGGGFVGGFGGGCFNCGGGFGRGGSFIEAEERSFDGEREGLRSGNRERLVSSKIATRQL